MWELDRKESWVLKKCCFWTVVLEKTLESALDSKEIKPVNPKRNQPWIFIGRTDADALILWPPDMKRWLLGKDPDVGKDWKQREKGMTEDEMAGWHPDSTDMRLSKLQEIVKDREAWSASVHGVPKSWPLLSDWTVNMLHNGGVADSTPELKGSQEETELHTPLAGLVGWCIYVICQNIHVNVSCLSIEWIPEYSFCPLYNMRHKGTESHSCHTSSTLEQKSPT